MTSEIRTNSLTSRAGLSTVTLTDSGPMFSGITTFVDNSTFSVGTGGTIHAPATNVMALGTNNIDAIKIDSSGNVNVTGILTASSISGGVSLASGADNRIVTATGAAALNAESTLTYDGTYLDIGGGVTRFTKQGSYNSLEIGYGQNGNQNAFIDLIGDTTYTDYGTRIIRNGQSGSNCTTEILHRGTGDLRLQTSDAADIVFKTNGNNERLHINSNGKIGVGGAPSAWQAATTSNVLQLGRSCLFLYNNDYFHVGQNFYYDGSNYKYIANTPASRVMQDNGKFTFYTAPSGSADANITWTESLHITANGNVKVTKGTSGVSVGALLVNTDYTNYGTIIVRDKNETYTSCLQAENENTGSVENRIYRSVTRNSADWAGANLEARFHNFRIQGSTSSSDKFYIDNNGARSNGTVSGTVCNSFRANTSYTNYGVFTARDASSANEHNAAFQVENPNTGSDTTNQFMRSVDASSNNWANAKYSAKSHRFHTSGSSAGTIVMNITDTGHAVHFGNQTNLSKYNSNVAGASWYDDKDSFQQGNRASIGWAHYYMNKIGSGDDRFFQFASDGSVTGYIKRNGSNTQYQTSSDYRLKKDVVALPNGIERVKQLRPVAFKWIADNTDMEGFLAHEAQEICPYAVSGTKDEVATEDLGDRKKGDMIVQAVDYGEFTPLLTAAMKELITKVETLEQENIALRARVTNLEGE